MGFSLQAFLAGRRAIAVFGSSEPRPGETLYDEALQIGARLARADFVVINGGYGGVMEAVSRGARSAGGVALGITMKQRPGRGDGNVWLSHEQQERDLFQRTRSLVAHACGYLVLPGQAGTLAEISTLWALRRAGCLGSRPIVLVGNVWKDVVKVLQETRFLNPSILETTRLTQAPDAAIGLLLENLP